MLFPNWRAVAHNFNAAVKPKFRPKLKLQLKSADQRGPGIQMKATIELSSQY